MKNDLTIHTSLRVRKDVQLQQKDDGYRGNFHEAKGSWSLKTLAAYTYLMVLKEKIIWKGINAILDLLI